MLRRVQVLIRADSSAVGGAFSRGRGKNRDAHTLLIRLFELLVEHAVLVSLKWIPTTDNTVADAISRRLRGSIIRLSAAVSRALWVELAPLKVDLMACSASVQKSPASGFTLPFFSRYCCRGSPGSDVRGQGVSRLSGAGTPVFGFSFPPPLKAGHVVQSLAEGKAHAVVVL